MWKITYTQQHANGQQTGPHYVYEEARTYEEAREQFTGWHSRMGESVEIVKCQSTAKSWWD